VPFISAYLTFIRKYKFIKIKQITWKTR